MSDPESIFKMRGRYQLEYISRFKMQRLLLCAIATQVAAFAPSSLGLFATSLPCDSSYLSDSTTAKDDVLFCKVVIAKLQRMH